MGPEVLYEDNHCLAVNKPAPLLTQGVPPGIPTLESQVKAYLKERYQKKGNVYLGIPHRLDRPVSGVVVFARNTKAARRLAEQFQFRRVRKVYWAAVERSPTAAQSELEGQETLTRMLVMAPGTALAGACSSIQAPPSERSALGTSTPKPRERQSSRSCSCGCDPGTEQSWARRRYWRRRSAMAPSPRAMNGCSSRRRGSRRAAGRAANSR